MIAPYRPRTAGYLVLAAIILAALPILLVAVPPILDYPNHLTRIWLLAGGMDAPPLSHIYQADWTQAATNVGVDFIASNLARILPFILIDKALLIALFLGAPLGAILLNRTVFGGFHPWQVAFLFFCWTTTSIAGFLNFQISLAAALFCATAIGPILARRPAIGFPLAIVTAELLLLIHPFGLLYFAALVSGLLIGPRLPWPIPADWLKPLTLRIAILAVACAVPLAALFLFAPTPPGANAVQDAGILWPEWWKMIHPGYVAKKLISPALTYSAPVDLLMLLPLIAFVGLAAITRSLRCHAGLLIAAVGLLIVALLAPISIGDATWMQQRIPPMIVFTLLAAILPDFSRHRWGRFTTTLLAIALLARIGWIGAIWTERQADVQAFFAATRTIPLGAAVIVVRQELNGRDVPLGRVMAGSPGEKMEINRHLPALGVMHGRYFIPTLFAVPGQQPLRVLDPWKRKSVATTSIPYPAALGTVDRYEPYVQHWRQDFDYLLLINADLPTDHPLRASGLRQVANEGFVQTFRINKPAAL